MRTYLQVTENFREAVLYNVPVGVTDGGCGYLSEA